MALADNTPHTIGRYEIKQLLGRGGMASVYLANDPHFARDVAVKVLPREFLHDPQFLNRFQREARTIASLDHPAIVPVYDYGEEDGQPYLVMRYMAGGSLAEHLRTRKISLEETTQIVRRIASALDEAHINGIVHRDLKPGNVLFDHRGDAFLSDFGIVKMTEGTATFTTGTGVVGTPAYMSPEQVHGSKDMDGRSDVYTLGIMLYQMVTGEMPYKADTPVKQMMAHVLAPIPDISQVQPDLPIGFGDVIKKALAKDRDERFGTASKIVTALETLINPGHPTPQSQSLRTPVSGVGHGRPASAPSLDDPTATVLYNTDTITNLPSPKTELPEQPKRSWFWYGGAGLLALLIVAVAITSIPNNTDTATPTPTSPILVAAATEAQNATTEPLSAIEEPTTPVSVVASTTEATPANTSEPAATATTALTPTALATGTQAPSPTNTALHTPNPQFELGRSASGLPLTTYRIGNGPNNVILIGGIHAGFAPASVSLAEQVLDTLTTNSGLVPDNSTVYIIPNLNPDSTYNPGELPGRFNGNGVDLNRNWDCRWQVNDTFRGELIVGMGGTAPFSEPEVAALAEWLIELQPTAVVFWQARATNGLVSPGSCRSTISQVSATLGEIYSAAAGYDLEDFEQLAQEPVNGDAVNWLDSQGIPAITVLLPDYLEEDIDNNLAAVLAILEQLEN